METWNLTEVIVCFTSAYYFSFFRPLLWLLELARFWLLYLNNRPTGRQEKERTEKKTRESLFVDDKAAVKMQRCRRPTITYLPIWNTERIYKSLSETSRVWRFSISLLCDARWHRWLVTVHSSPSIFFPFLMLLGWYRPFPGERNGWNRTRQQSLVGLLFPVPTIQYHRQNVSFKRARDCGLAHHQFLGVGFKSLNCQRVIDDEGGEGERGRHG